MKEMFVLLFISELVYNNIYKNNNKYFPIVNKSLFLQYYNVCFLLLYFNLILPLVDDHPCFV